MKRVFLGINLPQELKNQIEKLKKENKLNHLPIKLVEPENSHIAIKFLDKLADEQIEEITNIINLATKNFKTFAVIINNSLAFPNFFKPRVLALKVISSNLIGLAKKLFITFEPLNFVQKEDKPYTPHITLGRIKENLSKQQTEKIKNLKFEGKFYVDSLQLFESQLLSDGPIYTIIKNFKLQ